MTYDIICYFMQFSMYGPWFLHTYFLIYDFKCLSDLGPGSLKKESERVFGDCFRYVWSFLFHICFLRKTKFYMPCVSFLFGSSCIFVCVSLTRSEGFSSGIFKFALMVRFIFPLVFGPLVLSQGRKGIKEVATKELFGVIKF